jgi:hypothetical protein
MSQSRSAHIRSRFIISEFPNRGYSFRAILRQSSQRLFVNCCPRWGTAPQIRQTQPLSRHRLVHALSFSRSASFVTGRECSPLRGPSNTSKSCLFKNKKQDEYANLAHCGSRSTPEDEPRRALPHIWSQGRNANYALVNLTLPCIVTGD